MRLWSIHPSYLDSKGLIALWRESLLALNVLQDKTKGYKNHPQLIRFKKSGLPVESISIYMLFVFDESYKREYNFNYKKIPFLNAGHNIKIPVTSGQIDYEKRFLLHKLKERRDLNRYNLLSRAAFPKLHESFFRTPGEVESWEKIKKFV